MANEKISVSEYNKTLGTINVSYDDEYFTDVSYNATTGEVSISFDDTKISSFVYVLISGNLYLCTYTYETENPKSLLEIEGVEIPYPTHYRMMSSTIVDSGRNNKGIMVGSVVREGVRKLELEWNYLSAQNLQQIMTLLESKFELGCVYYDTIQGDWLSKTFYAGDRECLSAKQRLDSQGKIVGYENVRISLVEV